MTFGIQIQAYKGKTSEEIIVKQKNLLLNAGLLTGFNLNRGNIRLLPPSNIKEDEITFLKTEINRVFDSS